MSSNDITQEHRFLEEGETYKILTFELDTGKWLASILFKKNGAMETHSVSGSSEQEAHLEATKWLKENTDL